MNECSTCAAPATWVVTTTHPAATISLAAVVTAWEQATVRYYCDEHVPPVAS